MIYMRLLTREQAEQVIREASPQLRATITHGSPENRAVVDDIYSGNKCNGMDLLMAVKDVFDLTNVPYTFKGV